MVSILVVFGRRKRKRIRANVLQRRTNIVSSWGLRCCNLKILTTRWYCFFCKKPKEESGAAGKRTLETLKAGEKLIEAIESAEAEKARIQEFELVTKNKQTILDSTNNWLSGKEICLRL